MLGFAMDARVRSGLLVNAGAAWVVWYAADSGSTARSSEVEDIPFILLECGINLAHSHTSLKQHKRSECPTQGESTSYSCI